MIAISFQGGEHIVIKLFSGRPTQKGLMMHKNVTVSTLHRLGATRSRAGRVDSCPSVY